MRLRDLVLAASAVVLSACAPVAPPDQIPIPRRCDADGARSLIGAHVGAVIFPQGAGIRVVCTTCPTTKDLRPDRLNVRFDQATGIIERVDCG